MEFKSFIKTAWCQKWTWFHLTNQYSTFRMMGSSTCICFCMFSLTSLLFSLPCYHLLYPCLYVLYCLAHTASHSLLSKCWHISFKCTVFIRHSLCPSPSFPHLPSSSEENLNMSWRDQSPDIYSIASLLLIFSPLLLLQLSHPTFIVNNWVSVSIFLRLSSSSSSVIYRVWDTLFIWFTVKLGLFYQIILMHSFVFFRCFFCLFFF